MKIRCPVCRSECAWEGNPHRPFCGERCRVVDLGNWADGSYAIAGETVSAEDVQTGEGDD